MVSVNAAAPVGVRAQPRGGPRGSGAGGRRRPSPAVLTDVLDLDEVTRVRGFGTAGLNRMWDQFTDADQPLDLPLYGGRIDPRGGGPAPTRTGRPARPSRRLDRSLGLRSVVLFGLAYMAPMIVARDVRRDRRGDRRRRAERVHPGARRHAVHRLRLRQAGGAPTGRGLGATPTCDGPSTTGVGFRHGWATLLDYFFLPMVIWLIGGTYLPGLSRCAAVGVGGRLHRAHHDPRRRGHPGGGQGQPHLMAGAPRRPVRQPRLGRVRHRQDDRRRPVRRDLPGRVRRHPVRVGDRRAGQRVAAALRDGPRPGAPQKVLAYLRPRFRTPRSASPSAASPGSSGSPSTWRALSR